MAKPKKQRRTKTQQITVQYQAYEAVITVRRPRQSLAGVAEVVKKRVGQWFPRGAKLPGRLAVRVAMFAGLIGFFLALSAGTAYAHRTVYVGDIRGVAYNKPVSITFARPVRNGLSYSVTEKVPGTWQTKRNIAGVSALVFQPHKPLAPGSTLHVQLRNVRPSVDVISKTPRDQTVTVTVEAAPSIQRMTPALDQEKVSINSEISVQLTTANRSLRDLELAGDIPVASPKPTNTDDKTFRWKLTQPLAQSRTYTAELFDRKQPVQAQRIAQLRFKTVVEPTVASGVDGYIRPDQTIVIDFGQDMVQDAKAVTMTVPGKGQWENPRRYRLVTGMVVPGTAYTYTVVKGARSLDGGFVAEDKVFAVRTPGAVRVVGARPTGNRVPLDSSVSLTFDQPVDRASAEAAFTITPQVAGSFSWSGTTMTFRPAGLSVQTGYSYSVAAGVKPQFGLPGVAFSNGFTTMPPVRKLAVPFYRQAHSLSCESASLRMALASYGVMTNDDAILARVGYAPQPRDTATNTWQDPYQMFVGSVDGRIGVDGWGVYSGPIAAAARSFGRGAEAVTGVSAQQIAAAIHSGNPVVLWGISGTAARADSWNTATSGVVSAPKNAHVRTVYGVEGTAENPLGFYIYDPLGSSAGLYWSTGQLLANSAAIGGHAVIVR